MSIILLTGTSSGFGLITAKHLAKQGHSVFATMRDIQTRNLNAAAELTDWAKQEKVKIDIVELDATDDNSVKLAVESIAEKTGGIIDVLINNAGTGFIGLNETLSASQVNQIFQINVIAADRMIKAVLPWMHKNKSGLIVTISSIAARQYIPVMGVYAASKAAIDALSVSYHYELKSSGIDIAIMQPGAYQTTDIVSKQMRPANPSAAKYYSEDMKGYEKQVFQYFEPTEDSRDPKEIAECIADLIETPQGKRKLWTLVGAGPLEEPVGQINTAIKGLTDTVLNARGVKV
ncbi:SDR family NAD(P)-dependent oxidoreductase [Dyadobacter subterraneus]|uniref:SDR family NAD(P)-dependent oxidoreductase n=1 Tax=Dyadobacter subterraneus TaxID=2773304 RepID=A0ABR9W876_9BACT|nr:SDR family NAD(P)-dependent oxidoreductase [Dyadobacter subterraneus]MBE9461681.1 SDR family NAD(P)-dependent oxidoreductase [Dyadobacter subterraneus]